MVYSSPGEGFRHRCFMAKCCVIGHLVEGITAAYNCGQICHEMGHVVRVFLRQHSNQGRIALHPAGYVGNRLPAAFEKACYAGLVLVIILEKPGAIRPCQVTGFSFVVCHGEGTRLSWPCLLLEGPLELRAGEGLGGRLQSCWGWLWVGEQLG